MQCLGRWKVGIEVLNTRLLLVIVVQHQTYTYNKVLAPPGVRLATIPAAEPRSDSFCWRAAASPRTTSSRSWACWDVRSRSRASGKWKTSESITLLVYGEHKSEEYVLVFLHLLGQAHEPTFAPRIPYIIYEILCSIIRVIWLLFLLLLCPWLLISRSARSSEHFDLL